MPISNPYLKRERQLKGWSQVYLAKQIEVPNYYISRWERGEVTPSSYYQQKLCDLFGKTAEELGFLQPKESSSSASLSEDDAPAKHSSSTSLPEDDAPAESSSSTSLPEDDALVLALNTREQTRDILDPPHGPAPIVDFPLSPHGSFSSMKKLTQSLEDNTASSLKPLDASLSQTAFLDLFQDLQDDYALPPASPPSAFSSQANTQFWHRKRNIYELLLLALISIVVVALLFSPLHLAIAGMIWHTPSATPSIAQNKPTATSTATATSTPTPTPKPTSTPILSHTINPAPPAQSISTPTPTPILSHTITSTPAAQPKPTPTPKPAATGSVQIDAGGTGAAPYIADTDFTGGAASNIGDSVDTSGVSDPAPESVYLTCRYGYSFSYIIPNLTPGDAYTVRLHFAETYWTKVGQRIFNVAINDQSVLPDFDIIAAAGGPNKAVAETFTVTAESSGTITIQFTTDKDNAQINAIQVLAD